MLWSVRSESKVNKVALGEVTAGEVFDESGATGTDFIIPRDVAIHGPIDAKGRVRVEGSVYGSITAAEVLVEPESFVEGQLTAKLITVLGRVKGALRAKHAHIHASAEITGDLATSSAVIEEGSKLLGVVHQEKYGQPKPVIRPTQNAEQARRPGLEDQTKSLESQLRETAEKMRGGSLREIAEETLKATG